MQGSLTNFLMFKPSSVMPEVGMGATHLMYTDRHPYTIIKVCTPRKIMVQADKAIRTDNNGMSDSQSYDFEPNPEGTVKTLRLTKKGWTTPHGEKFSIGHRSAYHDYSF